jgi:hypothetical protein
MLTEELWSNLREILLQFSLHNKAGLRKTVEGILFRMQIGVPWRDLPKHFSKWNSIYKVLTDLEWVFIDGSYVKAHQHSAGAATGHNESIGKSRASDTSKVRLAVSAYGLPEVFTMASGCINDCTEATTLIEKLALRRC